MAPPRTTRMRTLSACLTFSGALLLFAGCGDSSRQPIEGVVTFEGNPLETGNILFIPQQGTPGPTAGATIENGEFTVSGDKGVLAGKFRVEITAVRPSTTNKIFDYETRQMVNVPEQFIPARYNEKSKLIAEVAASGPNRFDFSLTSK